MIRLRLLLCACFLLAFGAGISVGRLWERSEAPRDDGWLAPLNLEPEQKKKIKEIWSEAMKTNSWQSQREKREAIQRERDDALKALILPEQTQRYEEIMRVGKEKLAAVALENKKLMDDAYERTKALLNEAQLVKYDELRQKRHHGKGD